MKSRFALLTAVLMLPLPLLAAVKVPALFSDHMVLQAGKPVAVWGTAAAGEKVTVGFGAQEKSVTAGQDGAWSVKLDPLKASPEPQVLKINTLTIQDVLVGEVWLGSGQSNMAMQVKGAKDLEASKAAAKLPQIRVFTEGSAAAETAQSMGKGSWIVCSPETVERFSATAYFFGRSLHEELKVPAGLIVSAVGGTPIESWIDAAAQRAQPELKGFFEAMAAANAKFDEAKVKAAYEAQVEKWKEAVKVAKAAKRPLPQKPRDPIETHKRKGNVGGLFNGKIAPLIPYTLRGAIWYQGEANSADDKALYYQEQLTLLAKEWRQRWGDEFPFAWVQLPNFTRPGTGWPLVRDEMRQALATIPNSGMAITLDVGELKDIHPTNKQEVGRRLALWALGKVYDKPVAATSGPLVKKVTREGASLVVQFDHAAGLKANAALNEFEVAGADHVFKTAEARLEGETVVLTGEGTASAMKVRYAWKDATSAALVNGAGIPASTFQMPVGAK
ncbi:MAG: sialate O-acetylesterase [Verrucomicrobiaceae bacterium]|nr:sialate O-acetylesterase [Verrucomicrobiaceae bacterium]